MADQYSTPPRGVQPITGKLVKDLAKQIRAAPFEKPVEIRDANLKGWILRIQPSGVMSYIVQVGRGRRVTLGKANILTLDHARNKAKIALGAAAEGRDPKAALRVDDGKQVPTLREFVEGQYGDWVKANRKTGAELVARIDACFFRDFGDTPMDQITAWNVEKWRKARLQIGKAVGTVNRDLSAIKACLNRALDWEIIDRHPLTKVKPSKEDRNGVIRYLAPDEENRLRTALVDRDEKIKAERDSGNQWREARGVELLPSLRSKAYADHLAPMVLLSLNTGMRQGEVFSLRWDDVDLAAQSLAIRGAAAKSGRTRHIPLNAEVVKVLETWKAQQEEIGGFVFPSKGGGPFDNVKKAWASLLVDAKITGFRWHDMRHHFASRLVMAGVDLNTVRELLGHSDIKMTLRYAHLAPEHKAAAVAKLVNTNR